MASVYVRIFKSYGSPANRQWSNVYELNDGGPVVEAGVLPTGFVSAAGALVDAERALHLDAVYFNRYTISTWQPDSRPYNPDTLVTQPLAVQGLNGIAGAEPSIEDLRIVAWIARKTATGRPGRAFYRGCLIEAMVENQGGKMRLTPGSTIFTVFNTFRTALLPLMPASPTGVRLAMIGGQLNKAVVATTEGGLAHTKIKRTYGEPWHIRNVQDVILQGATIRQTASAYFDRP